MKSVCACFLSAFFAVLLAQWWNTAPSESALTAQDRYRRHRQIPGPVEELAPQAARFYDDDGLTPEEVINVAIYDAVNRGVVNIHAKVPKNHSHQSTTEAELSGSGAVLNFDGHILTNYHVVEDAIAIQVSLYSGESFDAQLIGADPSNDVAILRIDAPRTELFPMKLGDSRELRVGMRAYALGNPFGLERTLTTGIISSLNRSLETANGRTIRSVIQTDADINPGSSGGPLLDSHGRLIGINTAIASNTGQSAGISFAIPSSMILRVIPNLLAHGRVVRPEIGIARLYQTDKGLLVAQLHPQGPAAKAGIRGPKITDLRRGPLTVEKVHRSAADLIVAVDDKTVPTVEDFLNQIDEKRPGEEAVLTVVRNGKQLKVAIRLTSSDGITLLKGESERK